MSFVDAITTCFTKYVDFSGRARRSEYWFFVLALFILNIIVGFIGVDFISYIVGLAVFLPSLAALARRLHDTGRSAWWILIGLVPLVGAIILIVFAVQDSEAGSNQYGPSPKG